MNEEEFYKSLLDLGIELSQEQKNKFKIYSEFLIEENKKTNLTAITKTEDIYLKHFFDSLSIVKAIDFSDVKTLLDIGSGAGFPGMVLKIVYPFLDITLLDSNNKKVSFLKKLSDKLEFKDVKIIQKRAEEFVKEKRENFDIVTARAVANLTVLSELSLPFVKINGYFIPLKGSNEEEIKESSTAINLLGGKTEKEIKFNLPYEESIRTIIKIKKIKNTPIKYPRRYEKILKNPLKN